MEVILTNFHILCFREKKKENKTFSRINPSLLYKGEGSGRLNHMGVLA